ncbi:MAG: ECF transporter S component [Erysipelotrichaceae bacterium]|nr:ECF transporter S component [Erysipelotrichaceae bacterium]
MNKDRVYHLVLFSLLLAIEFIFCFTPLGSIPIGPIVATLAMIPVVITAEILGLRYGLLMGFITGLFSFIVWTFMPPAPVAFLFTPFVNVAGQPSNYGSLLVVFVPRILTGATTYLVFKYFKDNDLTKEIFGASVAGFVGSMTNTVLVLGLIWLVFGNAYADIFGAKTMWAVLIATFTSNGLMEAVITAISAPILYGVFKKLNTLKTRS